MFDIRGSRLVDDNSTIAQVHLSRGNSEAALAIHVLEALKHIMLDRKREKDFMRSQVAAILEHPRISPGRA